MAYLFRFITKGKPTGIYGYSAWDDYSGLYQDINEQGNPHDCEIVKIGCLGSFFFTLTSDKEWSVKVKEIPFADGLTELLAGVEGNWLPFPDNYTLKHAMGAEVYNRADNDDAF